MKAIKVAENKKGVRFAIVQDGETFRVIVRRENYAAHCKGGLSQTWRLVKDKMTFEEASELFNRRIK